MRKIIGAQGEVNIYSVESIPDGLSVNTDRDSRGRPIVGYSTKEHHHVLDGDVELLEHPSPPEGVRILYASLEKPVEIVQTASGGHKSQTIPSGYIEFRISREYDPFEEEIRQVQD